METYYRIEPTGEQFSVIDFHGNVVDILPTKEAAEAEIERCKKEDQLYETGKLPADAAVNTHMELHDLDRETAERWIRDVMGGA